MVIMKFGGSSIGTPERVEKVISIIIDKTKSHPELAVIFSAFQGVTDSLIKASYYAKDGNDSFYKIIIELKQRHIDAVAFLVRKSRHAKLISYLESEFKKLEEILLGVSLVRELTDKTLDFILSFGELLSNYIITEAMISRKLKVTFLDSRNVIKTDNNFGSAKVNFEITNKLIQQHFKSSNRIQIVTGFLASSLQDETTTLGRGGSDYTASILGAALNAKSIEIWTDVDGVLTANPQKVNDAFVLNTLTYEEAMELSHFGAKVIHPPTMIPAMKKNIPIIIKNTFNPYFQGSIISKKKQKSEYEISGITSVNNLSLVRIEGSGMIGVPGIAKRIFGALSKNDISIILITQASSEHSICLAVKQSDTITAVESLSEELKYEIRDKLIDDIIAENNFSIIAIVGENMRHKTGVAGKVFASLGKNGINIAAIAQGASELNISVVIDSEDEEKALTVLHNTFFFPKKKSINLYIAGASGQVGSELVKILNQNLHLFQKDGIDVRVRGLINSQKMILNYNNTNIENMLFDLTNSTQHNDIKEFTSSMLQSKHPNKIFLDCTAKDLFVDSYEELLNNNISIVTPNKIANSSSLNKYRKIHRAKSDKAHFLYETNVGASLPIISTLRNMLESGDKVLKIEGVFSGTLSYLFNTYDGMLPFSELVKKAQKLGYTEPDPRDDLDGLDAARKLLILGRELGYPIEIKDIKVSGLISKKALTASSIELFYKELAREDNSMLKLFNETKLENKLLRYIAKITNNSASVSLEKVEHTHPTAKLSGSESLFMFYTAFYGDKPLIIQGPGAGARLTASGVYSDLLKIIQAF